MRTAYLFVVMVALAGCTPEPPLPVTYSELCSEANHKRRVTATGHIGFPDSPFITCAQRGGGPTRCDFPLTPEADAPGNVTLQILDGDTANSVSIQEPEGPSIVSQITEGTPMESGEEPDPGTAGEVLFFASDATSRAAPARAEIVGEVFFVPSTSPGGDFCTVEVDEIRWPEN